MNQSTNMTSPAKPNALPDEWIAKLFTRFSGMYGSKFADLWSGCDIAGVRAIWAEDLGGFSGDEIRRGIDACKTRTFPPTLPEFVSLCRPPLDFEAAFHHAISQMHNRRNGEPDRWNSKAIYWAAASLGVDLMQEYRSLEKRWKATLAEFIADEPLPDIPEAMPQLPPPGKQTAAPEVAKAATSAIKKLTSKPREPMQHWLNIRDRYRLGEKFPEITINYCREALANMGEKFEREPGEDDDV